jgi:hypothetical protein
MRKNHCEPPRRKWGHQLRDHAASRSHLQRSNPRSSPAQRRRRCATSLFHVVTPRLCMQCLQPQGATSEPVKYHTIHTAPAFVIVPHILTGTLKQAGLSLGVLAIGVAGDYIKLAAQCWPLFQATLRSLMKLVTLVSADFVSCRFHSLSGVR